MGGPTSEVVLLEPVTTRLSALRFGRLSEWVFWGFKGSLAILDQGLIAASNFVISILLARWLTPEQYGSYALAFAIFLFVSFAYQALLLEPQRVFGPSDFMDSKGKYLGALLSIHLWVAVFICAALGVSAWIIHEWGRSQALAAALGGTAVMAPSVLLLWLARGAFYVQMSPQNALCGSVVYCFAVFLALACIFKQHILSPFSAFLIMALAALVSSAVLLTVLKPSWGRRSVGVKPKAVFRQHWVYGRWILLSSVLSWMSGDIYYLLVSTFSGISAAASLRALLNFYLPVAQIFGALSVFILPYVVSAYQEKGITALPVLTWRITAVFTTAGLGYWAALLILTKPILHFLYAGRYTEIAALIPLLAAASLPWNVAMVPGAVLRAVRSSASLVFVYCASSVVAVLVGIPATKNFGLRGALWTMLISNLAALLVAFFILRRKLDKS